MPPQRIQSERAEELMRRKMRATAATSLVLCEAVCVVEEQGGVHRLGPQQSKVLIEQSLERQILRKKSLWHCTFPESRCREFFRPP